MSFKFLLKPYLIIFFPLSSLAQKFTISGYVRESGSAEFLTGVNIYVPKLKIGTTTNLYGFYSITLPEDSIKIICSYIGYLPQKVEFYNSQNQTLDFNLASIQLNEIEVKNREYDTEVDNPAMGILDIPVQTAKNVPSLIGEKDVMKVLQLMPGVQKGSEANAGLYVRGGGPDQNLIIVDEAPIYNPFHVFGFVSLFNLAATKSITMLKGGFPARYGGRLSSVIEMQLKDGNKEKFGGEAGLGLISAKLELEGPIKKGKSSWLISGRRSYVDAFAKPFLPKTIDAGFYFYDLNVKAAFDINARNKLVFSAYTGYDNFNLTVKSTTKIYDKDEYVGIADQTNKNTIGWGNRFFTTRWSHVFSNKLFSNATLLYSDYGFNIYSENVFGPQKSSVNYISSIATGGLRYDMEYFFSSKHHLKFGLHSLLHRFNPSATIQTKDVNATAPENPILGLESAIYLEDDFKISQRWRAIAGVRLSHFVARNRQYMMPEPRISIQYKLLPDLSVKANYTLMNQYLHMVQNSGTNLPTDIWVPSTEKILPQYAQQWALGIVKDFDKQHFFISLEAYYKKMENILGYKEGSNFLFLNGNLGASKNQLDWQNNVNQGQAWSYGTELLIQKKEGRFNGWIGYTLSWNIMQFDAVNFGKPFFAKYDRRHDISITGNYKLTNKITISATWVYTTGNRLTLPIGKVHDYELNKPMTLYSDKNSIQVKPYHRLDVGVQFHKNLKKGRQRIWEISIYNVYNRLNTFYYFTQADEVYSESGKIIGSSISLKEVSVLPIIPSLSYTFKF